MADTDGRTPRGCWIDPPEGTPEIQRSVRLSAVGQVALDIARGWPSTMLGHMNQRMSHAEVAVAALNRARGLVDQLVAEGEATYLDQQSQSVTIVDRAAGGASPQSVSSDQTGEAGTPARPRSGGPISRADVEAAVAGLLRAHVTYLTAERDFQEARVVASKLETDSADRRRYQAGRHADQASAALGHAQVALLRLFDQAAGAAEEAAQPAAPEEPSDPDPVSRFDAAVRALYSKTQVVLSSGSVAGDEYEAARSEYVAAEAEYAAARAALYTALRQTRGEAGSSPDATAVGGVLRRTHAAWVSDPDRPEPEQPPEPTPVAPTSQDPQPIPAHLYNTAHQLVAAIEELFGPTQPAGAVRRVRDLGALLRGVLLGRNWYVTYQPEQGSDVHPGVGDPEMLHR